MQVSFYNWDIKCDAHFLEYLRRFGMYTVIFCLKALWYLSSDQTVAKKSQDPLVLGYLGSSHRWAISGSRFSVDKEISKHNFCIVECYAVWLWRWLNGEMREYFSKKDTTSAKSTGLSSELALLVRRSAWPCSCFVALRRNIYLNVYNLFCPNEQVAYLSSFQAPNTHVGYWLLLLMNSLKIERKSWWNRRPLHRQMTWLLIFWTCCAGTRGSILWREVWL